MEVDHIIRTAIAGFYTDRLPGCREALSRVVDDGREGGAVGSAMMALSMGAFDDLNAGRWDAAQDAAARGHVALGGARVPALRVEWSLRHGPHRRQPWRSCGLSRALRSHDGVGRAAPDGTPRRLGTPRARPGRARSRRLRGELRTRHRHQRPGHPDLPQPPGAVVRARPGRRGRAHRTHRRGSSARRRHAGRRPRPPLPAVRSRHRGRRRRWSPPTTRRAGALRPGARPARHR